MSEDSMLMCLIAFVLGYLVARMIRGDGLSVGGKENIECSKYNQMKGNCRSDPNCEYKNGKCIPFKCPTTTAEFIKKIADGGTPNFEDIKEGVCFDTTSNTIANAIHNQENCSKSKNKWCPFSSSLCPEPAPPPPPPSCPAGATAAPEARYCSDLVGWCQGPGGSGGVNGKYKHQVASRDACQAFCDAAPACVGYSYWDNSELCQVHGPGLDTDLGGWRALTHPATTISGANGASDWVCAAVAGHNDHDNPPVQDV